MLGKLIRAADRFLSDVMPSPFWSMKEDAGFSELEPWMIEAAANEWLKEWRLTGSRRFMVHDSVHWILNAPPSVMGEATVVWFQARYGVYDPGLTGAFIAVLGALMGRSKSFVSEYRPKVRVAMAKAPKRIRSLRTRRAGEPGERIIALPSAGAPRTRRKVANKTVRARKRT